MDHLSAEQRYRLWLQKTVEQPSLHSELQQIGGNDEQIYERFYRDLTFGTAGLRGLIGAGTNRMNVYTVGVATQGLADYLNAQGPGACVAIAYDSRIKSDVFARHAACVLAANGIAVHLFDQLMPTPTLSFAVRQLGCRAGIVITASHNPAAYNGYKCYGADGCQMTEQAAEQVMDRICRLDIFEDVRTMPYQQAIDGGLVRLIPQTLVDQYLDRVAAQQIHPDICREIPLHVVYTPLHGAGNKPVRAVLDRIGVQQVSVVAEQEQPDGNFPTAPYPNPETREAFACALEMAQTLHPDLLIATDPDSDRMGAAVPDEEGYTLLTGNEIGCLLLEYILSGRKAQGRLPVHPVTVKSIVTSDLAARIAEAYGCACIETLTGFKYIGEQIGLLEEKGEQERFQFGFEESHGYLSGTYVRDKDGVVAAMLLCEAAAFYKKQGLTLLQQLHQLYRSYGVFRHTVVNKQFEGAQGMEQMKRITCSLRQNPPRKLAGLDVLGCDDYLQRVRLDAQGRVSEKITLPVSDVLVFRLQNGASIVVRPSGTEPKIKAYLTAVAPTVPQADEMIEQLRQQATQLLVSE